jgi:hypothetical protein
MNLLKSIFGFLTIIMWIQLIVSYISIELNKIMIHEAENKIKKIKKIKEKIKLFISKVIANKFD